MPARRKQPEKLIQRQIELELGAESDLLILRNSVGEARYVAEATGREYTVPYGLGEGSPDLVGILRRELRYREPGSPVIERGTWDEPQVFAITRPIVVATWFALEVKVPGEDAEPHQEKCHAVWRSFGAFVAVVHSVDEAREALERAREGWQ